jgi:hypothetical protein
VKVKLIIEKADGIAIISDGWSNVWGKGIINYTISTPQPLFYKSTDTRDRRGSLQEMAISQSADMDSLIKRILLDDAFWERVVSSLKLLKPIALAIARMREIMPSCLMFRLCLQM